MEKIVDKIYQCGCTVILWDRSLSSLNMEQFINFPLFILTLIASPTLSSRELISMNLNFLENSVNTAKHFVNVLTRGA